MWKYVEENLDGLVEFERKKKTMGTECVRAKFNLITFVLLL